MSTKKDKDYISRLCRHSQISAVIFLATMFMTVIFSHFDLRGMALCALTGAIFFIFMVRSWKHPKGWSSFIGMMLVIVTISYVGGDGNKMGNDFLAYIQHLSTTLGVAFLLLSIYKEKVLNWVFPSK